MEKTVNCNTKGNLLTMNNMAIGGPAAFRFEDVPCDRGEYSEKSANFLQDKLMMKLEPSTKIKLCYPECVFRKTINAHV